MNPWVAGWVFFRLLRWASWLGLIAFSIYFVSDRTPYLNSFSQLTLKAEAMLFGLGTLGMFAGLFELMMREGGGIARPDSFRPWRGFVQ